MNAILKPQHELSPAAASPWDESYFSSFAALSGQMNYMLNIFTTKHCRTDTHASGAGGNGNETGKYYETSACSDFKFLDPSPRPFAKDERAARD